MDLFHLFSSHSSLLACPILPLSLSPLIFPCNLCFGSNCEDSSLVVIPQLCPKFKCCQIDNNVITCPDCQGFCPKWDLPLIMIYDAECQSLLRSSQRILYSKLDVAGLLRFESGEDGTELGRSAGYSLGLKTRLDTNCPMSTADQYSVSA
ncbi:hypothetical protein Peur_003924 [Populus x canadensis]